MNLISKLGLGTAQWGMKYGIANSTGKPSIEEVGDILNSASLNGITLLDTASAYGDAEYVIGVTRAAKNFSIVTKILSLDKNDAPIDCQSSIDISLKKINTERIFGLLIHDANVLCSSNADRVWSELLDLKKRGTVDKIGISVYYPHQLETILDNFPIDIVQLPFSIYDQRFLQRGLFKKLHDLRVEVHIRSIFLQGILLCPSTKIPKHLNSIRTHHDNFLSIVDSLRLTPLQAALGFCLAQPLVDRVIVGCESVIQLNEIIRSSLSVNPELIKNFSQLFISDQSILLPINWPKVS
jgi:aryl-alcohol dehydrogenase-like predicted oxidoreductase